MAYWDCRTAPNSSTRRPIIDTRNMKASSAGMTLMSVSNGLWMLLSACRQKDQAASTVREALVFEGH